MARAITGNTAGNNLAPFGDKATQQPGIFIIDHQYFLGTETANLPTGRALSVFRHVDVLPFSG
jgi:hypothetical protein